MPRGSTHVITLPLALAFVQWLLLAVSISSLGFFLAVILCPIIANAPPQRVFGTPLQQRLIYRLQEESFTRWLDAFLQFPNATKRAWFHFSSISPGNHILLSRRDLCHIQSHLETEGHSPWSQKAFNMHYVTWGAVSLPILQRRSAAVVRQAEHGRCSQKLICRKVCMWVCVLWVFMWVLCLRERGCDVSLASCRDN